MQDDKLITVHTKNKFLILQDDDFKKTISTKKTFKHLYITIQAASSAIVNIPQIHYKLFTAHTTNSLFF